MQNGLVIGTATATVKHPSMAGSKLLVVQFLAADGRSPDGEPVLAVDRLGAGIGETVMLSSDGKGTRELLGSETTPVRWSVMAIPD
jgi:ethanolamine utilization protein EutN